MERNHEHYPDPTAGGWDSGGVYAGSTAYQLGAGEGIRYGEKDQKSAEAPGIPADGADKI